MTAGGRVSDPKPGHDALADALSALLLDNDLSCAVLVAFPRGWPGDDGAPAVTFIRVSARTIETVELMGGLAAAIAERMQSGDLAPRRMALAQTLLDAARSRKHRQ